MSDIYLVEEFERYEQVAFYTIRHEEKEESETDLFIARFFDEEYAEFISGYKDHIRGLFQ